MMAWVTLAEAVAHRFPAEDVDRVTAEILAELRRRDIRLLQDGTVLLTIAERLKLSDFQEDRAA